MSLAWTQIVPEGMPRIGRTVYEGLEKLDERYVLGFSIPSHSDNRKVYHLTFDPLTLEIFHYCTATQTRYCSRAGMERWKDHTTERQWSALCRHAKVIKRWATRHKQLIEDTRKTLIEVYRLEEEMARERRSA